jgi:hypothetical protein
VELAHLAGSTRHRQPAALPEVVVVDLGHGRYVAVLKLSLRRLLVLALPLQRSRRRDVQLDREHAHVTRADGWIVARNAAGGSTKRQERTSATR